LRITSRTSPNGSTTDAVTNPWATVDVAEHYLPILRNHFGRHLKEDGVDGGGTARVQVAAPTPLDLARNLAGWGALIDVVGPEPVRAHLARIGGELTARYGDGAERRS